MYYLSKELLSYGVQFEYLDEEYTYVGDTDEYKERKREMKEKKKLNKSST